MGVSRKLSKSIASLTLLFSFTHAYAECPCPCPYVWGSAEYLYWWVQDSPINAPLITQNNNPVSTGAIGESGTQIIYGSGSNNDKVKYNGFNGGRFTIGGWFDEYNRYGVEGSFFGLGRQLNSFSTSPSAPVVAVPFFNTETGQDAFGTADGVQSIGVENHLQSFGAEVYGLFNTNPCIRNPFILLGGFRFINLSEELELTSFFSDEDEVSDDFRTKNNFYGFQIGTRKGYSYQHFNFDLAAKIAFGITYQTLEITGDQNVNANLPIGIFAEPSNSGIVTQRQFAVLPEIQAKLGYQLAEGITPFVSYNFLYLSNVIRPGQQIDRNINPAQNPLLGGSTGVTAGPPFASFNTTGVWMQGFSAGIAFSI